MRPHSNKNNPILIMQMKTVVKLLALFIAAQLIGLIVANAFVAGGAAAQLSVGQLSLEELFFMVIGFAFAVLLLLVLIRLYKGDFLYRVMEFVVVTAATFVVFYGIGWYAGYGSEVALLLAVALSAVKFAMPAAKNATATISSAGVAVMFALFLSFWEAVIFLVIMSAYDYVAVFVTRHMVTLASEFGKRDLSFSITSREKIREKVLVRTAEGKAVEKIEERTERLELGTGDIALPLAFNLVVFKEAVLVSPGAAVAAFIVIGVFSALALGIVLAYVRKRGMFLPALPPILLGALLGYMVAHVSGMIV